MPGAVSKAIHLIVSGAVQGVGYRQGCRQVARSLGLVGWVRNLPDGRVEVVAQGESDALDSLVAWAWAGPASAVVAGVETEVIAMDRNLTDFLIHPGPAKNR